MADNTYDVIVVGARCAGSPTAMLLARQGYRVLLVDRATFPSDTISSHILHPPGVAALRRWGLLDRLVATGCPPIDTYVFDFGPVVISGRPGTEDSPVAYCPRRTVLDKLLIDAAAEAGVEVREAFAVEEVTLTDGRVTGIRGRERSGRTVAERARVVVGADGHNSIVARAVDAPRYHEKPELQSGYYSYWSGLPMYGRFETYIWPHGGFAAAPTHDGLTLVIGGWPYSEFETRRKNLEASYLGLFDHAPAFAERIRAARREERIVGHPVANFFRKPFGPGWALVGDAGYSKDPITAQGIVDAFRDAGLLADALDESLSGRRPYDAALSAYQTTRDEQTRPMYEFTCQLATLEPPPPELARLLGAVQGNHEAMDDFTRVSAGMVSPAVFFSEQNVGRIFAAAQARGA